MFIFIEPSYDDVFPMTQEERMDTLDTIILEHVKASELPTDWIKRIKAKPGETLRVTIVKEVASVKRSKARKPNRSFGMWADRQDIGDAGDYVRQLRQPRYGAGK